MVLHYSSKTDGQCSSLQSSVHEDIDNKKNHSLEISQLYFPVLRREMDYDVISSAVKWMILSFFRVIYGDAVLCLLLSIMKNVGL